jgi:hypothetical protein
VGILGSIVEPMEAHNDIDILFVVDCARTSLLSTAKSIRAETKELSFALNQSIDSLILTKREFKEQPLRDMSELQSIARPLSKQDV